MKASVLSVTLMMAFATIAQANTDTTISTVEAWNWSSGVQPFGEGNTATYGQTITTGEQGLYLDSFTFYLSPLNIPFTAEVGTWNGDRIGEIVYQSASILLSATGSFNPVTVNPGINLVPDAQYVLYFTTSGIQSGTTETNRWGYLDDGASYAGGEFVFINNGNDRSQLTQDAWTTNWNGDLVFSVNVVAVPEPSTYGLLLIGLGLVGYTSRRKQLFG
ncbi:FxDxF family PEP-CTERM protein [Methylobacillus gramineus]|uniref:FxDxF family PEP-CTERM protein n=1 Tax=Methylobacillus gramineus TaxID=755169 RepID=UPI001CFFFBDB|nr:FxDxF family PEP-CTERM protein [Methylobacillus gramineus]MCB5185453.1 FxDxF family PEP-CTERM protein [Methylobacillus gramineus]